MSIAAVLNSVLKPHAGPLLYLTYFPAIFVTSIIGGLRAGLASVALCALAADYLEIPPIGLLTIERQEDLFGLITFMAFSVPVVLLAGAWRRSAIGYRELSHELESRERFLRTVLEASADCVEVIDSSGRIEDMNEACRCLLEMNGFDSAVGRLLIDIWPKEARPLVQAAIGEALAGGTGRFSAARLTKRGAQTYWEVLITPVKDGDGHVRHLVSTARDITQRKAAEEHMRLLLREVNHRAKNMLAVVQAIAMQTAATAPRDFLIRFSDRVHALSMSQDLLVNNEWNGVDLEALVRSQLAPFEDLIDKRIKLAGPTVFLSASAAQTIGMVLHELSTNAGKYGALSNGDGRVDIGWSFGTPERDEKVFEMFWREEGGPPVEPPSRRGFGSTVIGRAVRDSFEAEVSLDFEPAGLSWSLRCPAREVVEAYGSELGAR